MKIDKHLRDKRIIAIAFIKKRGENDSILNLNGIVDNKKNRQI